MQVTLRWVPHGCVAAAIAVVLTVLGQSSFGSASAADQPNYRSEVLSDSPVGYWRLAEPSGTAALDETAANSGAYLGGPALGHPGAIVDGNPAVRLDGIDDTTRVPTAPGLNPTSALSAEAWVNPTRLVPRKYAAVARKSGQYALSITAGAGASFRLVQGGVTYEVKTANNATPIGEWHHVVGTYDGTTMTVYVDGVARATRSLTGPIATSFNPLYLGSTQASAEWLTGGLDEVAIYPTALAGERVRAHYDQARTTAPPADTTPPAVTLTEPADGATTGARPTFAGAAGADAGDSTTVTVKVYPGTGASGTPAQTLTATRAGGSWSAAATQALDPGTYTAQAEQSDAAGNTGRSAARSFSVEAPATSTYASDLMADGPRGYWRLGESSGTAAVDQTGAFPGTYNGGVTLGSVGAIAGDPDAAARLDGLDDSVKVLPSPALNTPNALSLEAWVKPAQLPAVSASIVRKDNQYALRITSTGQLVLRLWKAGAAYELKTANGNVRTGTWQHVAATYDGAAMRVYVNGTPGGSMTLAGPVDVSTASLYWGSTSQAYDWLSGTLDEVAVYDKALSPTRVQARYAAATASDALPPAVTLTQPVPGGTVSDGRPAFQGAAGDAAGDSDAVTVKVYAGASAAGAPKQTFTAARSGGSWSARAPYVLESGTYTAQAEQSDAAGNIGKSAATTFTVQAPAPTTYAEDVLFEGARGYWRLGEETGTTAADETGIHPGTYAGGVTLGRAGALSTDPNTAALFDGNSGNVRIADEQALNFRNALTLEAWLNATKLPTAGATIIRKDLQYMLRVNSNGSVTFRLWKGGVTVEAKTPANAVTPGSWHQLVATYDGSAMRVHVDTRELVSVGTTGPADASTTPLYLGTSGGYDLVAGTLDEVAVYDKALSAARIQQHYQRAAPPDTSAPLIGLKSPAGGSTTDATPTFGGQAGTAAGDSAHVTVKIYSGASAVGTPVQAETATKRGTTGMYSVKASSLIASGTYTAQAEQSDAAGNIGKSATKTFTVDTASDPKIVAAGDIAGCSTTGDEATADVLDGLAGTVTSLGDHAYDHGTAAQFDCYDLSWGRHKARTRPIIGDHEFGTSGAAPYFDYFGAAAGDPSKAYYSYDIGNWHVVALDSYCWQTASCNPAQLQWLQQDLFASTANCTLALLHEPRFSSGTIHGDSRGMEALWQALYDAGADVVLSASEHVYERFAPQTPQGSADGTRGLRQFTVGTGGRSLYSFGTPKPNSEVRSNDTFGVLSLTLHAGSYDWKFVPEAGKTFTDGGSAVCH